jgi:hypothetical protein
MNYRLSCDTINTKLFFEEIGFKFSRKQIIYNNVKNKKFLECDPQNIIPNGSKILKTLLLPFKRKELSDDVKKVWDSLNKSKTTHISRGSFKNVIDFLNEKNVIIDNNITDKIYFDNSKWVQIKNIEISENDTFDFSLQNNPDDFWEHSVLYNGILGHQTPNGYDPIYYGVYDQALRGINDFHITDLRWFKDPRYAKNLSWVKCDDIVHYMLNRGQYNDDEVVMKDFDLSKYKEYLEQGYKPYSPWFEGMSKKFKYDPRMIAQELECLAYDTEITIRNKETGDIEKITIGDLYNKIY